MPPHVLHCWSYGQGRWRGHHWQWPRARLHQYQHLNPCSGCPRCSDAMTPTCRRRPSALAKNGSPALHKQSPRGFLRRAHSAQPTECARRKKPHGDRLWRAGEPFFASALSDSTICNSKCTYYSCNEPSSPRVPPTSQALAGWKIVILGVGCRVCGVVACCCWCSCKEKVRSDSP